MLMKNDCTKKENSLSNKSEDLFKSEDNLKKLQERISDYENGLLSEHEIIETE